MRPPVHLVWFKRDLRVHDHVALAAAAQHAAVLPLYVVEPDLWRQPDASARQWTFVCESLQHLDAELRRLGAPLVVRHGDAVAVLADLLDRLPVAAVHAHEETGNGWTFARDRCVRALLRERGVAFHEHRQHGVIRGLRQRYGWAARWERQMRADEVPAPERLVPVLVPDRLALPALDLVDAAPGLQRGGRPAGLAALECFFGPRGRDYRRAMATPVLAFDACSRLSPHLAYGTLSLREVNRRALRALARADLDRTQRAGIVAFRSRLHWHCHFMQKLESEPAIETSHFHRAYDALDRTADPARLAAFREGRTGFPFVDACLRALAHEGWINFRVRALLVSFASYHLWLDWRTTGPILARWFTDYEPGIHWSQMQMQSGTTGINTVRLYDPLKQSRDLDPTGAFVRRWVPELAPLPTALLHQPPGEELRARGIDYPPPLVDRVRAAQSARERVYAIRRGRAYAEAADAIQARHGSRRSGLARTGRGPSAQAAVKARRDGRQLALDL